MDDFLILVRKRNIFELKTFKVGGRHFSVQIFRDFFFVFKKALEIIYEHSVFKNFHYIFKNPDENPGHGNHQAGHDCKLG